MLLLRNIQLRLFYCELGYLDTSNPNEQRKTKQNCSINLYFIQAQNYWFKVKKKPSHTFRTIHISVGRSYLYFNMSKFSALSFLSCEYVTYERWSPTQSQILKKGDNCNLFLICSYIKRVNYAANIELKVYIKQLLMLYV